MNQYDALIRDFLYEHKAVSFEKIGDLSFQGNAGAEQPSSAISFRYNKRALTTPELTNYIAEKTGKSKVLIGSDLESFMELMRQFINIGKPYEMEGVGIFKLAKSGEYAFDHFDTAQQKEEAKAAARKPRPKPDSPLAPKPASNRGVLMLFALLIVLGVLGVVGWGSYKLFLEKKNATPVQTGNMDTLQQTTTQGQAVPVTTQNDTLTAKDTLHTVSTGAADYKFIHETTNSAARAYERVETLKTWGHPAALDSFKRDTITTYLLYFRYRLNASDTAVMRDSIQKLLNRKVVIRPA